MTKASTPKWIPIYYLAKVSRKQYKNEGNFASKDCIPNCILWIITAMIFGNDLQCVPLSSKIDQLSLLESTTVSRATPLCVLCMS